MMTVGIGMGMGLYMMISVSFWSQVVFATEHQMHWGMPDCFKLFALGWHKNIIVYARVCKTVSFQVVCMCVRLFLSSGL